MRSLILGFVASALGLGICGCSSDPATTPAPGTNGPAGTTAGKLYFEDPADEGVWEYDFAAKSLKELYKDCDSPSVHGADFLCIDPSDLTKGTDYFNVYVSDRAGVQRTKVIDTTINSSTDFGGLAWSPDGSKFAMHNYDARDAIKHVDFDPKESTAVYAKDGTKLATIPGLFHPTWLPDGRLVLSGSLYLTYFSYDGARVPKADGIYVVDANFGNPQRIDKGITNAVELAASPDGTKIAFKSQTHIFTIHIDGTGLQQITTGAKEESWPAWSPDGQHIACTSKGSFEYASFAAIAIVDANVTTPTDLTNEAPVWPRQTDTSDSTQGRLNALQAITWVP
jgi:Tol biopolymer transport system component